MSQSDSIFNGRNRRGQAIHDTSDFGIDTQDYELIKKMAIDSQPVAKEIKLSDIEITAESVRNGLIIVNGKTIACEKSFFKGLSQILHVSSTLEKSIRKTDKKGDDGGVADAFYSKLIEALKSYKATKKGEPIQLIANPRMHSITNIIEGEHRRISNESMFKIIERIMNDYPTMKILDMKTNGGDCGVKLLKDDMSDFGNFGGPDGGSEIFKFGMSMENSGLTTKMDDFSYRLMCDNGMMGMKTINNFTLKGISADEIENLFKHINSSEKRGFMPFAFKEHLELAAKCNASLKEINNAFDRIRKFLVIEDKELKDHYVDALEDQYFKEIKLTQIKVAKAGFDPLGLTDKQMAFINSGMNMWDLINRMTYIGSHKTGFEFENYDMIQKLAGKQFHEEYDLAYQGLMRL